jgi:hypothetical protein
MALTELSYVGTRPYIRGADLYAWFERQIAGSLHADRKPVVVRQFRLVNEVVRDGSWCESAAADASATLDVVDGAERTQRYSFCETGDVINRRSSDIPSNLCSLSRSGDFAGDVVLTAPRDTTDLLNGLIEANKRLHAETLAARGLPADRIRLIFIENLPVGTSFAGDCEAEFRHLGERKAADRVYTLNAVRLGGGGGALRICYSY